MAGDSPRRSDPLRGDEEVAGKRRGAAERGGSSAHRGGYRVIDAIEAEVVPLRRQLCRFSSRQPACRALAEAHYGVGPLTAVIAWTELGDCRRFSRSMQVVRHSGLDVTVHDSDGRRPGGMLSREGPATLRWALFEAGKSSARIGSPDYDYYQAVKRRHDGKLAAIAWPESSPDAAITPCGRSIPSSSRPCRSSERLLVGFDGCGPPVTNHQGLAVSSRHARARRPLCRSAL